jgi:DNA repair protein RecN (Recombination protein N)
VTKTVIPTDLDRDLTPTERTIVRIQELREEQQRCDEIAQIAGGKSAQEAIAFATSLLSQAQTNKQGRQNPETDRTPPPPQPQGSIAPKPKVSSTKKGRKK